MKIKRAGCWLAGMLGIAAVAQGGPAVTNYTDGETLRYPVALLRGTLDGGATNAVQVINTSSRRDTREIRGAAFEGQFKGMAELVPGTNRIVVRAGGGETAISLVYVPQTNPYRVRAFYFVPADGNTRYETPFKDDAFDFRGKYDTMLKCAQSFVAEQMQAAGYGRKTFTLEFDEGGKVIVHVVKAARPVAEYETLGRYPIASTVGREVAAAVGEKPCNYFGCVAFSRHIPKDQPGAGHATCYGMVNVGDVSLFGGAIFYTWPSSLSEVIPRLTQDEAIDRERFHADDNRGGRIWATAANTWGASLHELIHAYYVPHCADGNGVMSTGYDQFNRYFTFAEPPTAKRKTTERFADTGRTRLSRITAAALAPTRFMALDKRDWKEKNTVSVDIDPPRGEFVFRSDYGVRFIAPEKWYGDGPHARWFVEAGYDKPAPEEIRIAASNVLANCKAIRGISARVVDAEGHYTICNDLGSLLTSACIRNWQFAPGAVRWEGSNAFPSLTDGQRKAIEAATATGRLEKGSANQVDVRPFARDKGAANTAVYALRVIRSGEPRAIQVLGAANDTLRVWVNGELVLSDRSEGPELKVAEATLKAGENILLVEAWNKAGWFHMTVRLADAGGKPLQLTDEGTLEPAVDFAAYQSLFAGDAPEAPARKPGH